MRLLGAILAGGAARRFGSDKAAAMLDGRALIDRVADVLGPQCDALVVCGRMWGRVPGLADLPKAGLGPMGGIAAALAHAARHGYDAVLTAPCDAPDLPGDLLERLGTPPSYAADLPVIGLWPATAAARAHAAAASDERSIRAFATAIGAVPVAIAGLANVNRPEDLAALAERRLQRLAR